jgi:hypothetical protein
MKFGPLRALLREVEVQTQVPTKPIFGYGFVITSNYFRKVLFFSERSIAIRFHRKSGVPSGNWA